MKCHFCGNRDTIVVESRAGQDGDSVRRRRECESCHKRFTTYERIKNHILWVEKKDGTREPFDRLKVKKGILRAIEKRPVTFDQVEKIIDQVEKEMLRRQKEEVPSKVIGSAVLRRLKRIDNVAWLRFVSVYLEFDDLKDFKKALRK